MSFVWQHHQPGSLSQCAVLDVGLKCPHSCEFCYYSFLDGSDDQFKGMRTAPFKPLAECKRALDYFAEKGFERIDITGGEPAMHPEIFEIVRYAEQEANLRVRLITLAQLLGRKEKHTGKRLLDALVDDAGMTDFLFSLHAVNPDLYYKMTKGKFARVEAVLDELDGRGFQYCTNTVACASNATHLPEIAEYLVAHRRCVYVSNFITMNAYMAWSGRAFGIQARYSDLSGPLRQAAARLESAGVGVNIRYGPYCAFPGLEKNLVGITGVEFDPFEWRNTTRNPFIVLAANEKESFNLHRRQLPLDHKTFLGECENCSLRGICDGVDTGYAATHGTSEFKAIPGVPVQDVAHYRRRNPAVFRLKQKPGTRRNAPVADRGRALGNLGLLATGLKRFYDQKLHRRLYVAELGTRSVGEGKVQWVDATELAGKPNQALVLDSGSVAEFRTEVAPGSWLSCRVRTVEGGDQEAKIRVRLNGALQGIDSREWPVNGRWRQVRVPVRVKGDQLKLSIACESDGNETRVAVLEPCLIRRQGWGYSARLVYRNLRHLGFHACVKKLQAWARSGVRDLQAG